MDEETTELAFALPCICSRDTVVLLSFFSGDVFWVMPVGVEATEAEVGVDGEVTLD